MVLYHGSSIQGLKKLVPQERRKRAAGDPACVYAAIKAKVAAPFMVSTMDDSWAVFGQYNQDPEYYLVVVEPRFREQGKAGGSLYTVANIGLTTEPEIGLGEDEWHCEAEVPVLSEEHWPSALAAMVHYGVKVVFLTPGQFAEFRDAADQYPLIQLSTPRGDGTFTITG